MLLILSDWKYWKCENNKLTLMKTSTFKNVNFAKFKVKNVFTINVSKYKLLC